jgi:hypothetical protein
MQEYRMTRVTFGITSAPFLATKYILQLAEENQAALPRAAKEVKESFYVDDGLPSTEADGLSSIEGRPSELSSLRIPRCYAPINCQIVDKQLIGFSDASERAHSAMVYLRSVDTAGGVHISLVEAKTKVALIKKVSLPRLDLCGAHLLARLVKHLKAILEIPTKDIYALIRTVPLYCIGYMEPVNG